MLNRVEKISEIEFDLIVIGGGITGAGIALDAASRGLSVCLFEKQDFASGTSSKSTKLIHGGLRYLKQFDIKLVRETGTERAVLYRNAPHIVHPEKMLLPIIKGGSYGKWMTWLGLSIYDRLAKVKKSERRKILSVEEALKIEPKLKLEGLKGAGYYTEYRTDDARLTIEVIKTSRENGAYCFNYAEVTDFLYENNKVAGVKVLDKIKDKEFTIKAKITVNAAGPWGDKLRKKDDSLKGKKLHLTKGVHIVVPNKVFRLRDTVYFDEPEGRMIFAIPRGEITYIGTTDTNYTKGIDSPDITKDDVAYLLNAVKFMFSNVHLTEKDIIASWSGLRPLVHEEGKSASEISRKDEIFVSPSGLITIAGGKLTGYRLMAKKIVDKVAYELNIDKPCKTKNLVLSGGSIHPTDKDLFVTSINTLLLPYSTTLDNNLKGKLDILYDCYGANITNIVELAIKNDQINLLRAEVEYSIISESSFTLLDYFIRRSGKMFFYPQQVEEELNEVAGYFQTYFNWEDSRKNIEIQLVKEYKENMLEFN